jgi:hypothetical protein
MDTATLLILGIGAYFLFFNKPTVSTVTPASTASSGPAPVIAAPVLSIQTPGYTVGQPWTLILKGPPNSSFSIVTTFNNGPESVGQNFGTTDANGNWTMQNSFSAGTVGNWTEYMDFGGGLTSNVIAFSVTAAPQAGSASTTSTGTTAQTTTAPAAPVSVPASTIASINANSQAFNAQSQAQTAADIAAGELPPGSVGAVSPTIVSAVLVPDSVEPGNSAASNPLVIVTLSDGAVYQTFQSEIATLVPGGG